MKFFSLTVVSILFSWSYFCSSLLDLCILVDKWKMHFYTFFLSPQYCSIKVDIRCISNFQFYCLSRNVWLWSKVRSSNTYSSIFSVRCEMEIFFLQVGKIKVTLLSEVWKFWWYPSEFYLNYDKWDWKGLERSGDFQPKKFWFL